MAGNRHPTAARKSRQHGAGAAASSSSSAAAACTWRVPAHFLSSPNEIFDKLLISFGSFLSSVLLYRGAAKCAAPPALVFTHLPATGSAFYWGKSQRRTARNVAGSGGESEGSFVHGKLLNLLGETESSRNNVLRGGYKLLLQRFREPWYKVIYGSMRL